MSDPGLNQRLRQRSRRSGLMIGLSMAAALMVCVFAFTMIYAQLEPVVSDFVGRGDIELPTAVPTVEPVAEAPEPTAPPAETEATSEAPPPEDTGDNQAAATETPPIEEADAPEGEFTPDYQIDAGGPVNLRPGPGVASGDAVIALPNGTPLMFMDEEELTTDPERDDLGEDNVWMRFETEDGLDGWIRDVDVSEYVP